MKQLYLYVRRKNYHIIWATVFMVGIFVHGSRMFSAYYAHDDLTFMAGPGATYTSGRWFLQVLYDFEMKIMGSHVNAKAYMGMVSFALIAVICCILAEKLRLKSIMSLILLSGVVVTFPYVTSLFGYTFTAGYYYTAFIMSLLAAVLVHGGTRFGSKVIRTIAGMILLGLSMAVYQAMLCPYVAFLGILAMNTSLDEKNETWKSFIARCLRYLLGCGGGCFFYYESNKIILDSMNLTMTSYQGLNQATDISAGQMLDRIGISYKEFFYPAYNKNYSFYNTKPIHLCYELLMTVLIVCLIVLLVREVRKKNYKKAIQLVILFLIMPLELKAVFLTADETTTWIYSLMLPADVMIYVCCINILERLGWTEVIDLTAQPNSQAQKSVDQGTRKKTKVQQGHSWHFWKKSGCYAAVVLFVYIIIYFGYTANVCYTKAAIQQQQAISYYNRLITRIQMTEGYATNLPVAYINGRKKNNESLSPGTVDSHVQLIAPYSNANVINDYNWRSYMRLWCGYSPAQISDAQINELSKTEEVQQMTCYPDDGSIKIVNGAIVIKFAD